MKKMALAFLGILFLAGLWSAIFPEPGVLVEASRSLELPSWNSWMGRDQLGRDLFTRVLQGSQVSVGLGIGSSLVALFIGICYGAVAGLGPRWLDQTLMRIIEVFMSLPSLVVMAVLAVVLQTQVFNNQFLLIFWALTLATWMPVARLTRNLIHQEKTRDYVVAAKSIGASQTRIFWHHLIPNLFSPLLIFWSLQVPHAILAEGLLSFLGFGVRSPGVSWGALLQEGWKTLASYPHLLLGPALILFLTILSLNLLLENFRKSLDPKLKWEKFS